jgi:Na+-transporting methylmalonyl-CoA/oxaloacetate decarboxylase gamma subunit
MVIPVGLVTLVLLFLLLVGGVSLIGQIVGRRPPLEAAPSDEVRRLAESVESLREEVRRMSGQMDALDERIDFTERLLSPPRDADPGPG